MSDLEDFIRHCRRMAEVATVEVEVVQWTDLANEAARYLRHNAPPEPERPEDYEELIV